MLNISNINGLITWDEYEIRERQNLIAYFKAAVLDVLQVENSAWNLIQIESPTLMKLEDISKEHLHEVYQVGDSFCLRPETTKGSYLMATYLLKNSSRRPPFIIMQAGKSYRKEQDKPLSHFRLKEFYQLEFQCIYSKDSKCDYLTAILPKLLKAFNSAVSINCELVNSDRLPIYSEKTIDIESEGLELASISIRNDFPNDKLKVLEIAIGLDRIMGKLFGPL